MTEEEADEIWRERLAEVGKTMSDEERYLEESGRGVLFSKENLTTREDGYQIADDNDTVDVVTIPDNAVPDFKTKRELVTFIKNILGNERNITIKSTGDNVLVSNKGIQRAATKTRSVEYNEVFGAVRQLLENAKYSGFVEADERHPNVRGQDIYHSGLIIGNKPYSVMFKVDIPQGNYTHNYAGHKISDIQIAPAESNGERFTVPTKTTTDAIRNISLAVLRGKVNPARQENGKLFSLGKSQLPSNAYDAQGKADINTPEFKAWFGDSKVVDVNGIKYGIAFEHMNNGRNLIQTAFEITDRGWIKNKSSQTAASEPQPKSGRLGNSVSAIISNLEQNVKGKDGYGLAHIIERRNKQGIDGEAFVKSIPDIIRNGNVYENLQANDRKYIISGDKETIIRLDWNGENRNWLVTAYMKESKALPALRTLSEQSYLDEPITSSNLASRNNVSSDMENVKEDNKLYSLAKTNIGEEDLLKVKDALKKPLPREAVSLSYNSRNAGMKTEYEGKCAVGLGWWCAVGRGYGGVCGQAVYAYEQGSRDAGYRERPERQKTARPMILTLLFFWYKS